MGKKNKDGGFFRFLYHLAVYGLIIFVAATVLYTTCLIVICMIKGEPVTWLVVKNGLIKGFYHAVLLDVFYLFLYLIAHIIEFYFFMDDAIWRMKQKRKARKEKNNGSTHLYRSE